MPTERTPAASPDQPALFALAELELQLAHVIRERDALRAELAERTKERDEALKDCAEQVRRKRVTQEHAKAAGTEAFVYKEQVRVLREALEPLRETCHGCGGKGWTERVGSAHDPYCDGTCSGCPIPVLEQVQCECEGGFVDGPVNAALAATEPKGGE